MEEQQTSTTSWEAKATAKYARTQSNIPVTWRIAPSLLNDVQTPLQDSKVNLIDLGIVRRSGILTERELEITESYSVRELLGALASGSLSALEVTLAFSKRAAIAQQLVSR